MRAESFNSVPTKHRAGRKHSLPIAPANIEVFVCKPMNGVRLTRSACSKMAANPPTIGPCGSCLIGRSHAKGRVPWTWPDGTMVATLTIRVPGTVQV